MPEQLVMDLPDQELPPLRDTVERAELHSFSFQIPIDQHPTQAFNIINPHTSKQYLALQPDSAKAGNWMSLTDVGGRLRLMGLSAQSAVQAVVVELAAAEVAATEAAEEAEALAMEVEAEVVSEKAAVDSELRAVREAEMVVGVDEAKVPPSAQVTQEEPTGLEDRGRGGCGGDDNMASVASDVDEEHDSESEDEEGDFLMFDEAGARLDGGCGGEEQHTSDVKALELTVASSSVANQPPPIHQPVRKRYKHRQRRLRTFEAGKEGSSEGQMRIETLGPRQPGICAAANYFWLYYAVLGSGCTLMPGTIVTQMDDALLRGIVCPEGQCHAILDDAEDAADADSVPGSNTTYEFGGTDPHAENGTLFKRPYFCRCLRCREDDERPLTERRDCPYADTVGVWQFDAVHRSAPRSSPRPDPTLELTHPAHPRPNPTRPDLTSNPT